MLAIRMQRTGRSGHAQFRVIVQDSRFSPTRGRVVSYIGSYNPHTKTAQIDSEKAAKYLESGAQPSDTVARLLKKEGIKLPAWVKLSEPKKRDVRNAEKRRSTAPAKPAPAEPEIEAQDAPAEEAAADNDIPADETPGTNEETAAEEPAPESPAAEETPEEPAPAEETPEEAPTAEPAENS
jgi:small subunit ribosomal protein S16